MDKIAKTKRAMRLQEWSKMYRAYQASGKTVLAWCEEQELSPKTFYYRLQKIRESELECSEKHEIVPLSPSPCALPTDNISCIKIIGNGITVYADAAEPSRRITRATLSEKKYKFTPFR